MRSVGILMIAVPRAQAQQLTITSIVDYECYVVPPGAALDAPAILTDQFGTQDVLVQASLYLCNPTTKVFQGQTFGGTTATLSNGETVVLPHLKCYKTVPSASVNVPVSLFSPQFGDTETAKITAPQFVCTTVEKTVLPH